MGCDPFVFYIHPSVRTRIHAHTHAPGGVEHDGLRGALEGVAQQRRLDHDEGVGHRLPQEDGAVVGGLVGGGVEELQELGAPEVELLGGVQV